MIVNFPLYLYRLLVEAIGNFDHRRNHYLSRKKSHRQPGRALRAAEKRMEETGSKSANLQVVRLTKIKMAAAFDKQNLEHAEIEQAHQTERRQRDQFANNRRRIGHYCAMETLRNSDPDWYEAIWHRWYSHWPEKLSITDTAAAINRPASTVRLWLEDVKSNKDRKRCGGTALLALAELTERNVETLERLDFEIPQHLVLPKLPAPVPRVGLAAPTAIEQIEPVSQPVTAL